MPRSRSPAQATRSPSYRVSRSPSLTRRSRSPSPTALSHVSLGVASPVSSPSPRSMNRRQQRDRAMNVSSSDATYLASAMDRLEWELEEERQQRRAALEVAATMEDLLLERDRELEGLQSARRVREARDLVDYTKDLEETVEMMEREGRMLEDRIRRCDRELQESAIERDELCAMVRALEERCITMEEEKALMSRLVDMARSPLRHFMLAENDDAFPLDKSSTEVVGGRSSDNNRKLHDGDPGEYRNGIGESKDDMMQTAAEYEALVEELAAENRSLRRARRGDRELLAKATAELRAARDDASRRNIEMEQDKALIADLKRIVKGSSAMKLSMFRSPSLTQVLPLSAVTEAAHAAMESTVEGHNHAAMESTSSGRNFNLNLNLGRHHNNGGGSVFDVMRRSQPRITPRLSPSPTSSPRGGLESFREGQGPSPFEESSGTFRRDRGFGLRPEELLSREETKGSGDDAKAGRWIRHTFT